MPEKSPDHLNLIGAVLVSVISGITSITRRVSKGQPCNILWVISEFFSAILCGYLMYTAYPTIQHLLPAWFTLPVAVAVTAHIGGRIFQEAEDEIITRTKKYLKP